MVSEYEVVKASNREEAALLCKWHVNQLARCYKLMVVANSDGTWTVSPMWKALPDSTVNDGRAHGDYARTEQRAIEEGCSAEDTDQAS